ncbi:MAG: hypothetical protein IH600_09690 [Bacteroidetes bacterium]|nr:hypothetical protein [Bacteroidota bacterium]
MIHNNTVLSIEAVAELASVQQPPCLSLYQPTHRRHPENQQDPIRFRNLIKELGASLGEKYSDSEVGSFLKPYEDLIHDQAFWEVAQDGLAVLSGPGLFRVFRLQRTVAELAIVGDNFHTKPLRRLLQSVDRYQVLGLSLRTIRLFEGNRDALDEISTAPGVPRTITAALGDELSEPHLTVASYGGAGQASTPMHHGHGVKQDGVEIDAERFFRTIDRAVLEHHSRPSNLPLILAALPEHHHLFRKVSHNPFLLAEGLTINPDAISIDELRERAWQVVEPQYQARLAALARNFAVSKSNGLGSDDLAQVALAAAAGRVATLLIESDRLFAGRLDGPTGLIEPEDSNRTKNDELLDDLGELVEKMSGRVFVIPAGQMPVQTGVAATYRY